MKEVAKDPRAYLLAGAVGVVSVAGCGEDSSPQVASSSVERSASVPSASGSLQLPEGIVSHKNLHPQTMPNEEACQTFWIDLDGKRRPLVQLDPVVVRVDGRCNTPLNDPRVGVYPAPAQEPGTASFVATNGDALAVDCYTTGQSIQDLRGPSSASEIWLHVANVKGEEGFVPEVNVGFVDEERLLKPC